MSLVDVIGPLDARSMPPFMYAAYRVRAPPHDILSPCLVGVPFSLASAPFRFDASDPIWITGALDIVGRGPRATGRRNL
jgi:hypothetical protein